MSEDLSAPFSRIQRLSSGLGLPEIESGTNYGTPALKLRGKSFARISDTDTLVLKCPVEQKDLLLDIDPEIYFQTDHYVGWPAVLIRLGAISDEELALRLADGWLFVAPPALAALYPVSPSSDSS